MSCFKQTRKLNLAHKGVKALHHVVRENVLANQGRRESNLSFNIKMKEEQLLKPTESCMLFLNKIC